MDIWNIILKISLIILVVSQIVLMIYLFYINKKRFKEDKKFWKHLDEEFIKSDLAFQKLLSSEKNYAVCEEEVKNEQTGNKK